MKHPFLKTFSPYLLLVVLGLGWSGCKKDDSTPANSAPTGLSTSAATNITPTGATISGSVAAGGESLYAVGVVCDEINSTPTTGTSSLLVFSSTVVGPFSVALTGLDPNTKYYARAFASNNFGTSYGDVINFTTAEMPANMPVVTSNGSVTGVTQTGASFGGNVTSDGGFPVTAKGVCWNTSGSPTVSLSTKTSDGSGTGSFTSSITGLTAGTTYKVRAYATNSVGTSYGNEVSFNTAAPIPTITDIDGNVYQTVQIGTQTWMKENLKVSKYRNGDPIPTGLSYGQWYQTTSGAYAIFDNNAANDTPYGKLYNFYAVADPRGLCPAGWHLPTDADWTTLENFLGGAQVAGGKLKAVSSLWQSPNTGATDESGFSGLPGGIRNYEGSYVAIGKASYWWSSSEASASWAWYRYLDYGVGSSSQYSNQKQVGTSVRCIKD